MITNLSFIPAREFSRIHSSGIDRFEKLSLISDMCRLNTLSAVKKAGSGHLGSSFSSLDIFVYLYYVEMNTIRLGLDHPDRDIFFSSKGHDVPGLYSVLFSLGVLSEELLLNLRRLDGTCGHPDIGTPGCEANTGSLGMGLSKGKGISIGKSILGRQGRVFVMTGDGELQEGQIYEALLTAAHQKVCNLTMIIDHNKVQTDRLVEDISGLGDIEDRLRSFGWFVARCDGHNFASIDKAFSLAKTVVDQPKAIIADTIKGRGISFMEHPLALKNGNGFYKWHSGAPDDRHFELGLKELLDGINLRFAKSSLGDLRPKEIPSEQKKPSLATKEYVSDAFGSELVRIAKTRKDIVVLDSDLAVDCRIKTFQEQFPDRFIENGIAEQDMVSTAGGLATQGLLPIVNSFAAFLSSRANEQIYNNSCEKTKIIYVNHYAGVIPAGPGASHQSVRDISLVASLPSCIILQPCNRLETEQAVNYLVNEASGPCFLRLVIGPSPRKIDLPSNYELEFERGTILRDGDQGILFAYGPVMLHEALTAAESLEKLGIKIRIVNMPWLNRVDEIWLKEVVMGFSHIFVMDDHSPFGGLGDILLSALAASELIQGRKFFKLGIVGTPKWGTPNEVLSYHKVDAHAIQESITVALRD